MQQKIFILFLFVWILAAKSWGQMFLADVQFDKVNEVAVEAYVNRQMQNDKQTFWDVKPSLTPTSSTDGFCFHEREYVIKDSLYKVWDYYVHTNPGDAWNAGKLGFGMLFSKERDEMIYADDKVDRIEPGQVVYLNLHLLKIKNIATAFEIIKVDGKDGVIEFSYLDDNVTLGKQQLNFVKTPKGYTKIVHRSFFKSESVLRDHFLYPYFHTRMTNTYHRNMKRMYKSQSN
ncbi:hypothetical protein OU798_02580 [Prolixibacteraceae bacterium Z1-6]|uniref:Uncharacterized protein n=1 Tax=Draconibacterium aestuarii TaxID=2998507 RepID=A0A9X3F3J3_9BACT|nr:hypothetical protein [Prolixibacteraceae bacterium Z1-6]